MHQLSLCLKHIVLFVRSYLSRYAQMWTLNCGFLTCEALWNGVGNNYLLTRIMIYGKHSNFFKAAYVDKLLLILFHMKNFGKTRKLLFWNFNFLLFFFSQTWKIVLEMTWKDIFQYHASGRFIKCDIKDYIFLILEWVKFFIKFLFA